MGPVRYGHKQAFCRQGQGEKPKEPPSDAAKAKVAKLKKQKKLAKQKAAKKKAAEAKKAQETVDEDLT